MAKVGEVNQSPREVFGDSWPFGDAPDVPVGALAARSLAQTVIRETANRSLRQIARDAGLSHVPLQKLTRGETWPTFHTLMKLTSTLDVDFLAMLSESLASKTDELVNDFLLSAERFGAKEKSILGHRCVILGPPGPRAVVLAAPTQDSDQIHRAIGAVQDCRRVVECDFKAILLPGPPTQHTSDLLKAVDISRVWRVAPGIFEGTLGTYTRAAA